MPNRYNQSSLEDIQRHTVTASTNPVLRLPSYSANILDISIKSVWLNNSSKFHLSVYSFRFKLAWKSQTDNQSAVTHAKANWDCWLARNPPKSSFQNPICPNSERLSLTPLPPCDVIVVYTVYFHRPSCMHMCFWLLLCLLKLECSQCSKSKRLKCMSLIYNYTTVKVSQRAWKC